MTDAGFDSGTDVEAAWTRFRGRLADHLAGIGLGESFVIELEMAADEADLTGCVPYLQFIGSDEDVLRAEVAGNFYVDARFALTDVDEARLVGLGWKPPTSSDGDHSFSMNAQQREVDRVAVMSVQVLREVYGCTHPVFLAADGLEVDSVDNVSVEQAEPGEVDEEIATFPANHEDLQAMVDRALVPMLGDDIDHDFEGDIPVVAGQCVVYARVAPIEPAVDLFAHVVTDVGDLERAELELGLLNRSHPAAKFFLREDLIVMKQRIWAWPFAAAQLRAVLGNMCEEIDDLARDLALRVDGRRFLEDPLDEDEDEEVESEDEVTTLMAVLLELLADGPVSAGVAANTFYFNDTLILRQITRLKADPGEAGDHDIDTMIGLLREALRFVVDDRAERNSGVRKRTIPPRPPTQQASLNGRLRRHKGDRRQGGPQPKG